MPLVVGLLLLILGAVALFAWFLDVVVFVKGLVVFSLFLWGALSVVVGLAGFKSKRGLQAAMNDAPSSEEEEKGSGGEGEF